MFLRISRRYCSVYFALIDDIGLFSFFLFKQGHKHKQRTFVQSKNDFFLVKKRAICRQMYLPDSFVVFF